MLVRRTGRVQLPPANPAGHCKRHKRAMSYRQIIAHGCLCPRKQRGRTHCKHLARNREHPVWREAARTKPTGRGCRV